MKKYVSILGISVVLLTFSSCGKTTNYDEKIEGLNTDNINTNVDMYIGLSVEKAQGVALENKTTLRVIEQDGTPLPATMDYRPGRINAVTQDGIVVSYTVE